jgi:dolichol-phosphate mannosyltransferase
MENAKQIQCVLVMPAYNEQDCIESVLRTWDEELKRTVGGSYKLLVVNDGSRDKTGQIIDRLAQDMPSLVPVHKPNGGHGSALFVGYEKALSLNPEWIFQTDSDDQFVPSDFALLWNKRSSSSFLLGRRRARNDAFHRLVITRILRLFLFLIFGAYIVDANVPFRLIRAGYLKRLLPLLPEGAFAPNIFLAVLAARDGQIKGQTPVTHLRRMTGHVSIVRWKLIKVCFRCVKELFFFRLHLSSAMSTLEEIPAKT